MNLALLLFYLFVALKLADAQRSDITPRSLDSSHNQCAIYKTCSQCIQQEGCSWCSQKDFSHDGQALDRCNPTEWFQAKNDNSWSVSCTQFENTSSPTINMVQTDPLGDQGVGYQMRPQRIAIKTGPHKPVNFQVQFRRVEGYPVDLYYIMDLSTSMKVSKDKLVNLAASLADTMRKITNDFQMGFGSFIDKPMSPFTNEISKPKPYLFKHHMKLSRDATHFATNVKNAVTYDNLDPPEGGLEALMQAVVCTKQIGWRSNSHRLVIFSTDAPYHLAGDGKLAGILSPNDESCHVSEDGDGGFRYEHFDRLDYPSIAQISRQIANNSVNVIFAVNQSIASTYRDLSARISGSYVGELTSDASNIVAIIQDQYNKISSSVRPAHRAPEGVSVSYTTSCSSDGVKSPNNRCDGITKGSTVTFDVTISVTKCRNQSEFKEVVEFFPVGVNEVVKIELDVSCQCPCEQDSVDTKSTATGGECNDAGKYRCGNCECNQGYWGSSCECMIGALSNPNAIGCKLRGLSNSSTSIDCSGRGNCICEAKCNCRSPPGKKVWGDYCQCDDFACPVSQINQQVCSGPLQGTCPCNGDHCECKPGWAGKSCDCPVSKATCYPTTGVVAEPCSGRGTCKCGKCECDKDSYGDYCEFLSCEELMDCVQCKQFKSGPLSQEECNKCGFEVEPHDTLTATKEGDLVCSLPDKDNCNIFFIRNRLKTETVIRVRKTKECSEPPDIFAIVGGVSGAILAIGLLLLLLWKILTTIHDRLEYAKFLRDRELAKWDRGDNPIYKRPTTIFSNPAYSKEN